MIKYRRLLETVIIDDLISNHSPEELEEALAECAWAGIHREMTDEALLSFLGVNKAIFDYLRSGMLCCIPAGSKKCSKDDMDTILATVLRRFQTLGSDENLTADFGCSLSDI